MLDHLLLHFLLYQNRLKSSSNRPKTSVWRSVKMRKDPQKPYNHVFICVGLTQHMTIWHLEYLGVCFNFKYGNFLVLLSDLGIRPYAMKAYNICLFSFWHALLSRIYDCMLWNHKIICYFKSSIPMNFQVFNPFSIPFTPSPCPTIHNLNTFFF